MLTINKITSHETVDFAASELKKYLRMMMPNGGDVKITFDPNAESGFRLGFMQDFGLDVSDVKDTVLDDILYVDTTENGGIIAGSNPRSVLMSVYAFLRENGCRWLFPGVDGEYIPMKELEAVKYRHVPSCRYRGPCIEDSCSQEILLETIDFLPKVGLNLFQMQFLVPTVFYKRHYEHKRNEEIRIPEPVSDATMLQWKTACEAEMSKRGIQFHDVGHGWTVAPFGVDTSKGWEKIDDNNLSEDARKYLALYKGQRTLCYGIALNTQFCMSSPEARKKVADYIADYASLHTNVDYLHVWLGDGHNNHCECEECAKKTVSDWYVMLLNEIDRSLAAKKLETRIVFIQYTETIWAPLTETIDNPDRFTFMVAPIGRSYTHSLTDKVSVLPPFERNKIVLKIDLDDHIAHYKKWRKTWGGAALAFEYHFWRHQNADPSGLLLAKRVFEDIIAYKSNGIDGIIACGSQRSYFPTGFAYYVYARKQFDISLSFEVLLEEYFSCAFGEDWKQFVVYLEGIADCFGHKYLEGEESVDPDRSKYYNPERAEKLRGFNAVLEKGMELIKSHYNSDDRIKTVSVRLLEEHAAITALMAATFAYKADGDQEKAVESFQKFDALMKEREEHLQRYFPYLMYSIYLWDAVRK